MPLKDGWRSSPLRVVHSASSTSQTSRGSTKRVSFGTLPPLKGFSALSSGSSPFVMSTMENLRLPLRNRESGLNPLHPRRVPLLDKAGDYGAILFQREVACVQHVDLDVPEILLQ